MLMKTKSAQNADGTIECSIEDALKCCIAASAVRDAGLTELRLLRFSEPVNNLEITYEAFPGENRRTYSIDGGSIEPISVFCGCVYGGFREGRRKIASLKYRFDQGTLAIVVSFKPGRPFAFLRR